MNLLASITAFLFLLTIQLMGLMFVSKLSCLKKITKRMSVNSREGEYLNANEGDNEWSSINLNENEIMVSSISTLKSIWSVWMIYLSLWFKIIFTKWKDWKILMRVLLTNHKNLCLERQLLLQEDQEELD